jgi:DNA repair exonuclease SbcCD ATPase subunit
MGGYTMKIKSFGLMFFAGLMTLGGSAFAQSGDRPPLTKVLLSVEDLSKELVRLDTERADAETARVKAQSELDALNKQSPGSKDADAIQKRIKDAEDRIKRVDIMLGKKKTDAKAKKDGPNKEIAAELERLANERTKAEAERVKAKAELDALNKQNPKAKDQSEAIQKRIRDSEAKIKHANGILGKPIPPMGFKATNDSEVKDALSLPKKIDDILKRIRGVQVTEKIRVEPTFDIKSKEGGIKIQWKGNP